MANFSGTISIIEKDSQGKYIHNTGYLNGTNLYLGDSDVYTSSGMVGILNFNKSILQTCNLPDEVTSWQGFDFGQDPEEGDPRVKLILIYREGTKPTTNTEFTFGLSSSKLTDETNFTNLTTKITVKPKTISGKNFTFSLTNLFKNLIGSSNPDILPDTETWYLYIKTNNSSSAQFYRKSNVSCQHSISFNGNYSEPVTSPFYLYEDDKWKTLTPYIYDGKWIQLDAKMF